MVHAWVERNDLLFRNPREQQSSVLGDDPIPEVTEFTPESWAYLNAMPVRPTDENRIDQLQSTPVFGSLSGVSTPHLHDFFDIHDGYGTVAVAGAHRVADEEVSWVSSGGPNRHEAGRASGAVPPEFALGPQGSTYAFSASRNRVDATAPSDIGPALAGLRVAGMRDGEWVRMGGTSAANPSLTRALANVRFTAKLEDPTGERAGRGPKEWARVQGIAPAPSLAPDEARPTPTPRKDDLYRRGKWVVR